MLFKFPLILFSAIELYFDMEMAQLEAIWADSSTQWNFDFEHRNAIQESINNAMNAQSEQVTFISRFNDHLTIIYM